MNKSFFSRKLFHLLIILIPLVYCYLGKWLSLAILVPVTAAVVIIDLFRHQNPQLKSYFEKTFGYILKDRELVPFALCGASFALIAACLNFLLFSAEIAVTSFAILALADPIASVVGRKFPSEPFFEKSKLGSATFFVIGISVLITCGIIFESRAWFYIFGIFSVFVATVVEARPSLFRIATKEHKIDLDDNFLIPISFSLTLSVFQFMWG